MLGVGDGDSDSLGCQIGDIVVVLIINIVKKENRKIEK